MKTNRYMLSASIAAFLCMGSGQAYAQEAGPTEAQAESEAAESTNAEIVVTATKRQENLQDVAAAITAVSGDALADSGVSDISGLQTIVPNLSLGDAFSFANLFSRGLGLNTSFGNVDPSVALYSDGAVVAQAGAQLFSFFDLERVEVLRGPQGTLYGRNSTGGLINLISRKPTKQFTGDFKASVGNYGAIEIDAGIGGPIIGDTLLGRVAVFSQTRNGFGKNVVTTNDVDDRNRQGVRGQLLWHAGDTVDVSLIAEYGRQNDASGGFSFQEVVFPDPLGDSNPLNNNLGAIGIPGFSTSGNRRDQASDVDPSNVRDTFSVTNIIDWDVSDNITIKNTFNYRDFQSVLIQDLDLSAKVNSSVEYFEFKSKQISEELQISYVSDKLDLIGGFYYFDETVDNTLGFGITGSGANEFNPAWPGNGRRVYIIGTGTTKSWALFWNAQFHLNDKITLRGGGRYTEDKRAIFDNFQYIVVGPVGGKFQITPPGFNGTKTFKDYTNEFGFDVKPNDDLLLYYTFAEGFKAGTQQISPPSTPTGFVLPESITSHEIGIKATLADRRVIANLALFTYKLDNLQLDRTIPGGPSGFTSQFINATTLKGQGVEFELRVRPTDNFTLNASAAYLHTELGSFVTIDPLTLGNVNIGGNRGRQSPEFTYSLSGDYKIRLESGGVVTLNGAVNYKSSQFFSEFNTPRLAQGAYTLFDARIAYQFPNSDVEFSIWGKNLTDKEVIGGAFAISTGRVIGDTFLPPRTWGASLSYSF